MATVVFGDFEWDSRKAADNLRKHGVSFDEASTIFADEGHVVRPDLEAVGCLHAIGMTPTRASSRAVVEFESSLPERPHPMSAKRARAGGRASEPSTASLREIPEVDFACGIQPHRYARLRSGYRHQVFVDPTVFAFFSSAEAVNEALRLLVKAAELSPTRSRRPRKRAA